eukprot:5442335-Pyramimonas_sp.AAC.1
MQMRPFLRGAPLPTHKSGRISGNKCWHEQPTLEVRAEFLDRRWTPLTLAGGARQARRWKRRKGGSSADQRNLRRPPNACVYVIKCSPNITHKRAAYTRLADSAST